MAYASVNQFSRYSSGAAASSRRNFCLYCSRTVFLIQSRARVQVLRQLAVIMIFLMLVVELGQLDQEPKLAQRDVVRDPLDTNFPTWVFHHLLVCLSEVVL